MQIECNYVIEVDDKVNRRRPEIIADKTQDEYFIYDVKAPYQ